MARLYEDFISGTTTDNPLLIGATTLNAAILASLPVVTGGDEFTIVIDPEAEASGPEIVTVTAHTVSATSATITRGQQGTSAVEHPSGTKLIGPLTSEDLDGWIDHAGSTATAAHPEATTSVRGFMSAADKDKLDDLGDFRKFILHGGYMDFSNFVVTSNGTFWPYDTTIVTPSDWNSAYISAFAEIQTHLSELDGTTLVLYASDGSNETTALVDQAMLAGDSMTMIAGGVHLDTLDTTTTLGLKVPVTNFSSDRSLFSFVVHYVMTRTS